MQQSEQTHWQLSSFDESLLNMAMSPFPFWVLQGSQPSAIMPPDRRWARQRIVNCWLVVPSRMRVKHLPVPFSLISHKWFVYVGCVKVSPEPIDAYNSRVPSNAIQTRFAARLRLLVTVNCAFLWDGFDTPSTLHLAYAGLAEIKAVLITAATAIALKSFIRDRWCGGHPSWVSSLSVKTAEAIMSKSSILTI